MGVGRGSTRDVTKPVRGRFSVALYSCGLAAAILLAVVGLALLRPVPAIGASVAAGEPPLVLTADPASTVHALTPGETSLWDVGVTVGRMPVSKLVGVLTASGGLVSGAARVPTEVELRGCTAAWDGSLCTRAERVILPATSTDALPDAVEALTDPSRPIPANVWVQARVTLASDAPNGTSGQVLLRLTVDASGADADDELAATGGQPSLSAALLGLAAVAGGFAILGLARSRRRA